VWRSEWFEQVLFARLLDKWLDPTTSFATAFDPVARSRLSGFMRKKRGVQPGCPDNWVLHCGRLICVELKSPAGRCSGVQRTVRGALIRAGSDWWECRTANSAMWALVESGVRFREIVHEDGSLELWRQPELAAWEVPRRDPAERRPQHPAIRAQRREYARRRRELHQRRETSRQCAGTASREGAPGTPGEWRSTSA
jgi:hypothetical protein